jgi:hypothetical protein
MAAHTQHKQVRLRHLESTVRDGLSFLDKIKVPVTSDERNEYQQYFLNKGYSVEAVAEVQDIPLAQFSYYLMIGRNPNA